MISRWGPREPRPGRPLSNRAIALGAVIVLGIGAVSWTVLLWRYGGAGPGVELDAIRRHQSLRQDHWRLLPLGRQFSAKVGRGGTSVDDDE